MKKIAIALMTVFTLSLASVAYAADNGTEFGIEDDLTVLGTEGTQADPDVAIKGFSVFGATQTAPAMNIPAAPGNIFVNGSVEVSSGMYVTGGSTFATGAYFANVSSFTAGPGSIYIKDGVAGQVLKKVGGGGMVWANDSVGLNDASMGNPRYLQMPDAGQTALEDSRLRQDDDNAGITVMGLSSMTVTGAFKVDGAAKFDGAVTLGDAAGDAILIKGAATAEQGLSITGGDLGVTNNATVGGTLGVTGDVALAAKLNVGTYATFGSSMTAKSDLGVGADLTVSGATILKGTVRSSGTFTVGEADENNFVVNATNGNTSILGTLGLTGKATLEGDLLAKGNAQLGDAVTDIHGVNVAPETDVALAVKGDGTAASGKYVAKFYSGTSLAAWIKTK